MISLEWVKEYIDIEDQDLEELAVKITKAGINIEKVITNHLENVVIGQVISCNAHPDSDHLHVCMVNIGKEELQKIIAEDKQATLHCHFCAKEYHFEEKELIELLKNAL